MNTKEFRGITLISLIVTIIILMILVGVTLKLVVGEEGIVGRAVGAKEQHEISGEKEIIQLAMGRAYVKKKGEKIAKADLQESINEYADENKSIEVYIDGEGFALHFTENDRYYNVDINGNIKNIEVVKDENPGNLKKGISGNDLDGTSEENAFEIWCIEDLVEWSKNYNTYKNSYIKLCQDLDFKSELSYANAQSTDYGNLNGDEQIDSLIQELQTGTGFTPITTFSGTFDGQNHILKNIYINSSGNWVAFIGKIGGAILKNITISGKIEQNDDVTTSNERCGGLIACIERRL